MLKNYIKIALKVLMRRKLFTLISLVGISFTLGVLIVTTAILDHVFGLSIWETKRNRVLYLYTINAHRGQDNGSTQLFPSYNLLTRRIDFRNLKHAEYASIFSINKAVVSYHHGRGYKLNMKRTDSLYWRVFDFTFQQGQAFSEEDVRNAHFRAVINQSTRRKIFGEREAVGDVIAIDGQRFKVIGVVNDIPGYHFQKFADVWVPITTAKSQDYLHDDIFDWFRAAVLVKSRADIPKVKEEFKRRLAELQIDDPRYTRIESDLETQFQGFCRLKRAYGQRHQYGESFGRYVQTVIFGLMLAFMLLPVLNLMNINVSRLLERASEIGVRKAFGASSWTLVGQFVVENVILTVIGGVCGLVLAGAVLCLLNHSDLIPYAQLQLNFRILFCAVALMLFFGVVSGAYPAWKMARLHPVDALRGGSR
ncbi:MAG: ABC transporter permease [Desulfobacterales bacterium]|nr:MAG: ABC transporter permease [Desulfobacterales bacterium]